jgi:hypothetical protein
LDLEKIVNLRIQGKGVADCKVLPKTLELIAYPAVRGAIRFFIFPSLLKFSESSLKNGIRTNRLRLRLARQAQIVFKNFLRGAHNCIPIPINHILPKIESEWEDEHGYTDRISFRLVSSNWHGT